MEIEFDKFMPMPQGYYSQIIKHVRDNTLVSCRIVVTMINFFTFFLQNPMSDRRRNDVSTSIRCHFDVGATSVTIMTTPRLYRKPE